MTLNETDIDMRLPSTASLGIERLSYRPPARAFAAVLTATDAGRVLERISVSGEIKRPTSVPALARPLTRGETIAEDDLHWIEADLLSRLPRNAVVEPRSIVGLVARRDLDAGEPILARDLAKPLVVEKNSLVTLVLRKPGMQLTARGRATAPYRVLAGLGDTVRVANEHSEQVVAGIVRGAGNDRRRKRRHRRRRRRYRRPSIRPGERSVDRSRKASRTMMTHGQTIRRLLSASALSILVSGCGNMWYSGCRK
ncbi:MAG: flagellar basal body P-ring formation chaperone FlgA [Hyphomicrobiales bacterium]